MLNASLLIGYACGVVFGAIAGKWWSIQVDVGSDGGPTIVEPISGRGFTYVPASERDHYRSALEQAEQRVRSLEIERGELQALLDNDSSLARMAKEVDEAQARLAEVEGALEEARAEEIERCKEARRQENLDEWHSRDGKQLGLLHALQIVRRADKGEG